MINAGAVVCSSGTVVLKGALQRGRGDLGFIKRPYSCPLVHRAGTFPRQGTHGPRDHGGPSLQEPFVGGILIRLESTIGIEDGVSSRWYP